LENRYEEPRDDFSYSSWDFIDWFERIAAQYYAVKKEHPPANELANERVLL